MGYLSSCGFVRPPGRVRQLLLEPLAAKTNRFGPFEQTEVNASSALPKSLTNNERKFGKLPLKGLFAATSIEG